MLKFRSMAIRTLPNDISVNPDLIMTARMNLSTRVSVYFGSLYTHVVQVCSSAFSVAQVRLGQKDAKVSEANLSF